MVSVSIFAIFRNNGNIKKALFVLFLLGVIFSIYSTMLHVKMKTDFVSVYSILDPDGKNAAGMSLEYLSRHSIPGLGVNNLESMLIAPLLIGFYYVMKSNRRMIKYFCILAIS